MLRRPLAVLLLTFIGIAVLSATAFAGDGSPGRNGGGRISVDGGLLIGSDELVTGPVVSIDGDAQIDGVVDNDVYVVSGDLHLAGRVRDDVVVIAGDAIITGRVDGDLVVFGGQAIVKTSDAFVGGDVRSTEEPHVAKDATVNGSVDKLGFNGMFGSLMFTLLLFLWLAITISGAIVGAIFVLVFPRAAEATTRASGQVGSSIAWGLGVGILGPLVAIVATVTIVGLPLGLTLGAALVALAGLGYVTAALSLGRLMVKARHPGARVGAFFAGFGILRFVALIPGLGALVGLLATIYGVGVLANAAWRASRGAPEDAPTPDAPPALDVASDDVTTPPSDDATALSSDESPTEAEVPAAVAAAPSDSGDGASDSTGETTAESAADTADGE